MRPEDIELPISMEDGAVVIVSLQPGTEVSMDQSSGRRKFVVPTYIETDGETPEPACFMGGIRLFRALRPHLIAANKSGKEVKVKVTRTGVGFDTRYKAEKV